MTDQDLNGRIEEVGELQDRLGGEWERLADRVGATPFLHPGFVLAWQHAFADGPLLLATVRRRDELAAVLPLTRRGAVLSSPANWHTPQAGVLAEDPGAAKMLARVLAKVRPRRLSLAFVDPHDQSTNAFGRELQDAGFSTLERTLTRSPYLEVVGDWAAFESGMRSKARADLRRRRRRLEERGTVSFEVQDGSSRFGELIDEVVQVEATGWKGDQATSIGSREDTLGFYRQIATWAAERGWLRMHFLRLDGQVLATSFALRVNGVHFGLKMGYDVEYRGLSPGMLMLHEIVRSAFEEGLRRVEMLGEDESYKRVWCPETRETIALQAFAPSLAGRIDRLAFTRGRPLAKRLVDNRLLGRLATGTDGPRL